MNEEITLVGVSYAADEIGQQVPVRGAARTVFCRISSTRSAEWFKAGQSGMKPAFAATVNLDDYQGEALAEYNGRTYSVYRTYAKARGLLELHLEEKGGIVDEDDEG